MQHFSWPNALNPEELIIDLHLAELLLHALALGLRWLGRHAPIPLGWLILKILLSSTKKSALWLL